MSHSLLPNPSDMADSIVSAAFEGDTFRSALQMIAVAFPGTACLIAGQDSTKLAGNFLMTQGGPEDLGRLFPAELDHADGWAMHLWQAEVGRVYQDYDLPAAETFQPGPIAQAFAAARPSMDCFAGVVFSRLGSRQFAIEVRFPRRRESELRQVLRDFLSRIARQLDFAVRISGLRAQVREAEQLATNLLDLLPFPVVLFDSGLQVRRMNGRARAMTAAGLVLSVGPDRVLRVAEPGTDAAFATQIAALKASLHKRVAILKVPRESEAPVAILLIVRLNAAQMPSAVAEDGPMFAVICESLSMPIELSQDVLWRVFGLSAKEAELALSLLEGASIGDVAVRRKVSKETLRNQLSAVMRKTHTARQQELVALLTRLATVNATV